MSITVTLSPEAEAKLFEEAARQGKDVSTVAAELLVKILEWEAQDYAETIAGIQRGLDDFATGKFRSFEAFATEECWEELLLRDRRFEAEVAQARHSLREGKGISIEEMRAKYGV